MVDRHYHIALRQTQCVTPKHNEAQVTSVDRTLFSQTGG